MAQTSMKLIDVDEFILIKVTAPLSEDKMKIDYQQIISFLSHKYYHNFLRTCIFACANN